MSRFRLHTPAWWFSHIVLWLVVLLSPLACGRGPGAVPTPTALPSPTAHASLMVVKFVDKQHAAPEELLQYSLVVMNDMLAGPDPGATVTMEDTLPLQLEFMEGTLTGQAIYEADSRIVRWVGQVPRGGSVEVRFRVRLVAAAAEMRSIVNTVLVTDAFGRQREASAQTHVTLLAATPTNSPAPPAATPTEIATVIATPALPVATATAPRPSSTPSSPPSPTPAEPETVVPFVYGLVVTPDESPVYYIVVNRALYRSVDRGSTWKLESLAGVPSGALVYVMAVDYQHPETMYVGTDRGLYRRDRLDASWGLVNTLVVSALAVDWVNPDVLWAGVGWGTELRSVLVKSEDGGRTWGKADHGIESGYVSAILVNPNDPNMLWAHVRSSPKASWPTGLVFRGGRAGTWERLSLGQFDDISGGAQNPQACSAGGLTYDPNLNALYVGCDITYFGTPRSYRLLRSLNADNPDSSRVTWELLADLGSTRADFAGVNVVRPLAVDAREPKSLFVFVDVTQLVGQPRFKLVVSHDDGQTWEEMALQGLPGG